MPTRHFARPRGSAAASGGFTPKPVAPSAGGAVVAGLARSNGYHDPHEQGGHPRAFGAHRREVPRARGSTRCNEIKGTEGKRAAASVRRMHRDRARPGHRHARSPAAPLSGTRRRQNAEARRRGRRMRERDVASSGPSSFEAQPCNAKDPRKPRLLRARRIIRRKLVAGEALLHRRGTPRSCRRWRRS